jgi:hypothetical protein
LYEQQIIAEGTGQPPQTRVNIEVILNPETIRKAHASKACGRVAGEKTMNAPAVTESRNVLYEE